MLAMAPTFSLLGATTESLVHHSSLESTSAGLLLCLLAPTLDCDVACLCAHICWLSLLLIYLLADAQPPAAIVDDLMRLRQTEAG